MNKRNNLLEKLIKKKIKMNTILSIVLVIALFYYFLKPSSKYAIFVACFAGGSINMVNGMNMWRIPSKRSMGMSYLLFGAIIIALGFFLAWF